VQHRGLVVAGITIVSGLLAHGQAAAPAASQRALSQSVLRHVP